MLIGICTKKLVQSFTRLCVVCTCRVTCTPNRLHKLIGRYENVFLWLTKYWIFNYLKKKMKCNSALFFLFWTLGIKINYYYHVFRIIFWIQQLQWFQYTLGCLRYFRSPYTKKQLTILSHVIFYCFISWNKVKRYSYFGLNTYDWLCV